MYFLAELWLFLRRLVKISLSIRNITFHSHNSSQKNLIYSQISDGLGSMGQSFLSGCGLREGDERRRDLSLHLSLSGPAWSEVLSLSFPPLHSFAWDTIPWVLFVNVCIQSKHFTGERLDLHPFTPPHTPRWRPLLALMLTTKISFSHKQMRQTSLRIWVTRLTVD